MMKGNFFECVAAGFQNKYKPKFIHDQTLIHFARILFTEASACASVAEILNQKENPAWQVTENGCRHPAIKMWIAQVHATEKTLHKTPLDWYEAYPKLLKGLAFRFIYYHRSYAKKPHRLFSAGVFAHLVAELYTCRIHLDKTRWIYPIESDDYIIETDMPTIHLVSDGDTFSYQSTEQEPLIVAPPPMTPPERNDDLFMLRKYSVENLQAGTGKRHTNVAIGLLKPHKRVHKIEYQPMEPEERADILYQIYPGNLAKTFYEPFAPEHGLYVFLACKKPGAGQTQRIKFAAKTESHDQYVYFQIEADTRAILVIYSKSQQEAETAILEETAYFL